MKTTKRRRAGATATFSVSVDPETKRALRALAKSQFGGNLSAAITDLAEDARRRMAAHAFLSRQGFGPLTPGETDELEAEIRREVALARRRSRRRAA